LYVSVITNLRLFENQVKIYIKSLKCSQDSLSRNELVDLKFEDLKGKDYSIGFILLFTESVSSRQIFIVSDNAGE